MLLFRKALTGSNWVLPGPRRTGKTMSTVKFKNGTTRKEGWKGQMTKYSAECLGANKKEVAGFFRVCGRWAVKMAAVQMGQCDGSSQVEVVFHSHPLSFLS